MVKTSSTSIDLGFIAPDFQLPDTVTGKTVTLNELHSEIATVIVFMCNHCPYVIHVLDGFLEVVRDYAPKGIRFAGISANDVVNYPDDHPNKMKQLAQDKHFDFPYLYDESQEVARAYDAACTPEFHIFNSDWECVYRGQLDDSRPGNNQPVTGRDVRAALDALIAGKMVNPIQKPSIGCNIKWKV